MIFEGEFFHSYIDEEINNPNINNIINYLIQDELNQKPFKDEIKNDFLKPNFINFENKSNSLINKYQNLIHEQFLNELLIQKGSEFWRNEILDLELKINFLKKKSIDLNNNINDINLKRSNEQKKVLNQLNLLKLKEIELKNDINKIKNLL